MRFLAVRSDRQAPAETFGKYVQKLEITCERCNKVTYHLSAPLLEVEDVEVHAQGEWLTAQLPKQCPDHPDSFLTPDRPRMP